MKVNVFLIKCLTNLHVGNGDVNYNIIDQEVEKDPITELPMINSSGVKGALKEHCENYLSKDSVNCIFGDKDNSGSYKFLQADLLFRPLRVTDEHDKSYVLATTEEIISLYEKKVSGLAGINYKLEFSKLDNRIMLEDEQAELGRCGILSDKEVAVVRSLKYDLPVIARNVLDEKGISQNLWYEEFVPHESIFYLIILTPEEMDPVFKKAICENPVQFGGNASIGYGYTRITEVKL